MGDLTGREIDLTGSGKGNKTGHGTKASSAAPDGERDDLDRRARELAAKIEARRPVVEESDSGPSTGTMAGMGQALKLSSEFIAGVAVGAGLGWLIDYLAGSSPWGLIVFLLLGFAAGVLNVLRSVGKVAEHGARDWRNDGQEK